MDRYVLYETPQPLPRAYVVYNLFQSDGQSATLDRLRSGFDPEVEAIVESSGPALRLPGSAARLTPAKIVDYSPNTVSIAAVAERDGLLVFNDTYYPGWTAWVDGIEQPILRTNYLFRGVMLAAGQHTIQFRYWSQSFQQGLVVSGATLFVLALGFGWYLMNAHRAVLKSL